MSEIDPRAKQVLRFWFEELPPEKHWARDSEIDRAIRERFGALHAELSEGVPPAWRRNREARLAAVIVLDQFSRNLFRDDGRAYAQDKAALRLADMAIASGDLDRLPPERGAFLVMPLMHAESLTDVDRSIRLLERIGRFDNARFGRIHRVPIERFGRYPARNKALGRETTLAEAAFLEAHPAGF